MESKNYRPDPARVSPLLERAQIKTREVFAPYTERHAAEEGDKWEVELGLAPSMMCAAAAARPSPHRMDPSPLILPSDAATSRSLRPSSPLSF